MDSNPSMIDTIRTMIDQSKVILTERTTAAFERYENAGKLQQAIIYISAAALLTGLFSLGQGFMGLINSVLATIIGFLVFTYLVHYIGKMQGGTGTYDQVAYSFSLFWAPLSVLVSMGSLILAVTIIGLVFLPILWILFFVATIFLGRMAVESSMNITDSSKAWLVLIIAGIASMVVSGILTSILLR